jgi:ABC-type branched-chain amino acid transport systems, periplasmic component
MKRFVLAIAAIALVVSGVAAQGTIKIGGIWTLADITGKQGSAAAQLAVDEINAAGGISGKTLSLSS